MSTTRNPFIIMKEMTEENHQGIAVTTSFLGGNAVSSVNGAIHMGVPLKYLVDADKYKWFLFAIDREEFERRLTEPEPTHSFPKELEFSFGIDPKTNNPTIIFRHMDKKNDIVNGLLRVFIEGAKANGLELVSPSGYLGPNGSWENYEIRFKSDVVTD